MQPMQWDTAAHLDFPIVGGYFLGPDPTTARRIGMYDAPPRATAKFWGAIARTGKVPEVRPTDRTAARADLRYWRGPAGGAGPPPPPAPRKPPAAPAPTHTPPPGGGGGGGVGGPPPCSPPP